MREKFEDKRYKNAFLHTSTLVVITQANAIIKEYAVEGYKLTLRQLYYQMVASNQIENTKNSYKRLSDILTTGRLNGMVDWDAMEDRVRFLNSFGDNGSPPVLAGNIFDGYVENLWEDEDYPQANYVEVWSEKDAVVNVVERACNLYRVPHFACRGYASITEIYNAGKRLAAKQDEGKNVVVLHIGDHDPSGMDMTRDNESRLAMIMRNDDFQLTRIALNMPQIKQYNPPPQPNKLKDNREAAYRAEHGELSWELDALKARVLEKIIFDAIEPLVDVEAFEKARACELLARQEMQYVGRNYEKARNLLLWADHHEGN